MSVDVRKRMTEGVSRSRLKLETKRGAPFVVLWLVGIAIGLIVLGWMVTKVSDTLGRKTTEVRFKVADDFGVFVGVDEVRFRGVPAGNITDVDRDGTQLILTARLQQRYAPIYKDAQAEMRSITPLNDVYLDIVDPGTPAAGRLEAGGSLAQGQTASLVTVPDVLDTLRADQRTSLHTVLDDLGNGLDDRGVALRRAFVQAAPFVEGAGRLAKQLAVRKDVTARLVHNTAVLTDALGDRETALRRLVRTGAATLGTLQRATPDLDATLRQLPPTLSELDATLGSVDGIVDDLDRGLQRLYPVADKLPAGLTSAQRLGTSLTPAAKALRAPVSRLVPLAGVLRPLASNLSDTARVLRTQTDTLSDVTVDLVNCKVPIQNFFQWNNSLIKYGDANAPVPRGNLAIGVPDTGTPGARLRSPEPACVAGQAINGRPAAPGDEG